jgi:hypothetical protein
VLKHFTSSSTFSSFFSSFFYFFFFFFVSGLRFLSSASDFIFLSFFIFWALSSLGYENWAAGWRSGKPFDTIFIIMSIL